MAAIVFLSSLLRGAMARASVGAIAALWYAATPRYINNVAVRGVLGQIEPKFRTEAMF